MNCLLYTGQRACSLYGACRYPATHQHFFASKGMPCSQGDQCKVEVAVAMDSILYTIDQAEQVERNIGRGLPWNCGCELCTSGKWHECYVKNGPDSELRSLIRTSGYTPPWHTTAPQEKAEADDAQAP